MHLGFFLRHTYTHYRYCKPKEKTYLYVYKFGPGRYRPSAGPTRRAGGASEGQQRRELTATASARQSRVLGLGAGHAAGGPARRVGRARTTSLRRGRQLAARRDAGQACRVRDGSD